MGFVIRCMFCIALVYAAVQWRAAPPTGARPPAAHIAAKPQAAPQTGPARDDAVRALLRSGVDGLTASAREWCLSAPRDCVAMLQRAQAGPPR